MEGTRSVRVREFVPSRHGFPFSNFFPCGPVCTMRLPFVGCVSIGNASRGLCGGMAFAVRDFFESSKPPPEGGEPPQPGTPFFKYLVRRLWDSFRLPAGPFKYFHLMRQSDRAIFRQTYDREWPRVKAELNRGRLSAIGFNRYRSYNPMRLGDNHHVLVYGYDWTPGTGEVVLHVYDPNYGGQDDLTITLRPDPDGGGRVVYSTGEEARGFLHTPYSPPRFAWGAYWFGLL
jgi:hypothetical protein